MQGSDKSNKTGTGRTRKRKQLLAWVLSLTVWLTACGSKGPTPWLGKDNYAGELVWLEPRTTEDGEMLEYREILNFEEFVSHSAVPVLICMRQKTDPSASKVIPQMETWAMQYRNQINFVFGLASHNDPLLRTLKYEATPTFFLLYQGVVEASAPWQAGDAFRIMEEKMVALIGEGTQKK